MPHNRTRHLAHLISKTLKFSPITGILGHRQVGKTTLAERLGTQYVSLDQAEDLSHALADPQSFLAAHHGAPVTIDECQLAPPLFPALKEWVRVQKKPGQFLLTGSVRFTSRKAIRESLTGRIITWELLPMDWSEHYGQPLPDTLIRFLEAKTAKMEFKSNPSFSSSAYHRYLESGGLPGVFGVRDAAIRAQRFETQINTILERDLKLLIQTTLEFRSLRALMVAMAKQAGSSLVPADLSRETRISLPALRRLIAAFEALFLIRLIPSEGDFSKPVLFFEDLGELSHLMRTPVEDDRALLMFLYQNLRVQFHYRPNLKGEIFSFRTRAGIRVPLCFRMGKNVVGLIPLSATTEVAQANQDAQKFIEHYPGAKVLLVSVEDQDQFISHQVRWVGAGRLV